MRILTLDPSSTCTGYAVMESADCIIDAGLLRPARPELPAQDRAWNMAADARQLIEDAGPRIVLIELPDGKVHRRIKGSSGGAGLSLYGLGVGIIYASVRVLTLIRGIELQAVTPADWAGELPKARRARDLRVRFPRLTPAGDRGLDMADAIGMGVWWFERRELIERSAML